MVRRAYLAINRSRGMPVAATVSFGGNHRCHNTFRRKASLALSTRITSAKMAMMMVAASS